MEGSQGGPRLLITGGVHGDELEPPLAIQRLARRPELAAVRGRLTLVPVVNEAAFRGPIASPTTGLIWRGFAPADRAVPSLNKPRSLWQS